MATVVRKNFLAGRNLKQNQGQGGRPERERETERFRDGQKSQFLQL